jgi:hypothetical protein
MRTKRSIRSKLLILATTIVVAFSITTPAAAQGIIYGSGVPAGAVVEQDVILVGQNVVIDGTVDGNVFILGNRVVVNGTVNGSLVLIGQNAFISGTVGGGTYAVALTLDLAPHAALQRDLYVAAVSLTSGNGSTIGRDLYALGLDSGLSGHVGRDLHTVIGPIQLYNGVMHLLGFDELTIKLHFPSPQQTSPNTGIIPIDHRAFLRPTDKPAARFDWSRWGIDLLRNWAILFLLGLLAYWLLRRPLERSGEQLKDNPVRKTTLGLLVLVIAIALAGTALLAAVLVFSLGLGLNSLGLWQLSIGIWALAYACLVLALAVLWFFIVYGTKIIVVFLAASWAFAKLFKIKAVWLDILGLLAGALLYTLVRSIPYIGWIIGVLVTAAGAGAAWLAYRGARRKPVLAADSAAIIEPAKMPARRPAKAASDHKRAARR